MITDEEFLQKEWPQHCGDILKVLKKTEENKNKSFLFECEFIKYPCRVRANKGHIMRGVVNNPQIEIDEFEKKEWLQNCGDTLKIIRKTEERGDNKSFLFECEFQKYPYKIKALKINIIKGIVVNPRIEIEEFINKEWPQHCGDTLKILKKTNERQVFSSGRLGNILYECEFIEHPYKIKTNKNNIIKGVVNNPQIEIDEFINKIWPQCYGEFLRILGKTEEKAYNCNSILFECEFINYPYKIKATKGDIKNGDIVNPNFPWKSKENLQKYIQEKFQEKPTLQEVADSLKLKKTTINNLINQFNLKYLIHYYPNYEEELLRKFIKSIYKEETIVYQGKKEDNYYEIDIYLPRLKLGFEYNGSTFHEEGNPHNLFGRKIGYHDQKQQFFKEKGIELIYIWDYEWFEDYPKKTLINENCKQKIKDIINSFI